MKNPERIKKIKQFLELANEKLGHDPDPEILEGLAMVLAGHVNELLAMMDEEDTILAKQLAARFFGPVIPREEPRPILTADVVSDYDEYGMFNFAHDDVPPPSEWAEWVRKQGSIERKPDEPTADEILKHTKSCDFRRGLKVCTCIGK